MLWNNVVLVLYMQSSWHSTRRLCSWNYARHGQWTYNDNNYYTGIGSALASFEQPKQSPISAIEVRWLHLLNYPSQTILNATIRILDSKSWQALCGDWCNIITLISNRVFFISINECKYSDKQLGGNQDRLCKMLHTCADVTGEDQFRKRCYPDLQLSNMQCRRYRRNQNTKGVDRTDPKPSTIIFIHIFKQRIAVTGRSPGYIYPIRRKLNRDSVFNSSTLGTRSMQGRHNCNWCISIDSRLKMYLQGRQLTGHSTLGHHLHHAC